MGRLPWGRGRGRTNDVGQDKVPAGDEGPELADGDVAVEVGRAGLGHARAELAVAEAGQHRGQRGNEEGDDDGGARVVTGHGPGQDVHAGPQRAAHAQRHQVQGVEAAGQPAVLPAAVHHLAPQHLLAEAEQHLAPHSAVAPAGEEEGERVIHADAPPPGTPSRHNASGDGALPGHLLLAHLSLRFLLPDTHLGPPQSGAGPARTGVTGAGTPATGPEACGRPHFFLLLTETLDERRWHGPGNACQRQLLPAVATRPAGEDWWSDPEAADGEDGFTGPLGILWGKD